MVHEKEEDGQQLQHVGEGVPCRCEDVVNDVQIRVEVRHCATRVMVEADSLVEVVCCLVHPRSLPLQAGAVAQKPGLGAIAVVAVEPLVK